MSGRDLINIVHDLRNLESTNYNYLLVAVAPDHPSKAYVIASKPLEPVLPSVFPIESSNRLLTTLAQSAHHSHTPTLPDISPLVLEDTFSETRELGPLLIDTQIPQHIIPYHSDSPPNLPDPAQEDLSPSSSASSTVRQSASPKSYTQPKWSFNAGTPPPEEFLSQAQRDRPPPFQIHIREQLPSPRRAADGHTEYLPLVIDDRNAVTAFLEAKFRQLQQLACKVVAKAWIKVIEPKKQSNHPYNKGDEFKPDWWPSQARHKEPDHLMKPERLILLISMLRCRRVEISQLRSSTVECAVSIPADKMEVLEEIYYVAEMEERAADSKSGTDSADNASAVWTIAPEKPGKSIQAAAAAAVLASSRSLSALASRTPDSQSQSTSTSPKRNSSVVEDDVPIDLSQMQRMHQQPNNPHFYKRTRKSPVMPQTASHMVHDQPMLDNQVDHQFVRYNQMPASTGLTPLEYSSRDQQSLNDFQFSFNQSQLQRRYTTGTVAMIPDTEPHTPVFSTFSVPRRHSQQIDASSNQIYTATMAGLAESQYEMHPSASNMEFVHMSQAPKAYNNPLRIAQPDMVMDDQMPFNPDVQTMAEFAASFGTVQASSI
ncbi:hypothetical protein V1512DRAFT_261141 [Lipomyces arxii]|uniref:uncharacterized protein n=1 Tax=Lipomyces arxii TaxID=56418 RepID=UPI0034CF2A44